MVNSNKPDIISRLLDFIAPKKRVKSQDVAGRTVADAQPILTADGIKAKADADRARVKATLDAEVADLETKATYLEAKSKAQARIDKIQPPKQGLFHLPQSITTTDKMGRKESHSLVSEVWRRIPMKPLVIPIGFVLLVLLFYAKACH